MLNRISTSNLRGDAFGGVTAAVIALPMALAFGVAATGDPAPGLWGAVIIGLVASLFGGTPTLISEPTGPMTVVFTSVILSFTATAPDKETAMAMAFTVVILAGLFQILFGVFRLGRYVTQMPYTVISGFMSGIGAILVILQLPAFLGQTASGGVMGTLSNLPGLIAGIQPMELALALITVAILWFTPASVKRFCPPQLLALVLGTVLSMTLFHDAGLKTIPPFNAELPSLHVPTFSGGQLRLMFVDAAVLGMLGCIDALLTSVVADSLTRTEHNSNKELVGQGLANIASGVFGGLPGAGATMGTVVNIQSGGRTALSGIVRAMVLMLVVRPIAVGVATAGLPLNGRQRVFLGWLAPRGIVTASVASLFSIRLEQAGILGAGRLQGLVFLTILMTVGLQGLTAQPIARALGLIEPEPDPADCVASAEAAFEPGQVLADPGQ